MKRVCRMLWMGAWLGSFGLGVAHAADPVVLGGAGSTLGVMRLLAEAHAKQETGFQLKVLPSVGSGGAIKGVVARSIEVGSVARAPKPDETAKGLTAVLLARTPVVLVTNRLSEKETSTPALVATYGASAPRWPDGQPVRLVLRSATETDTVLLGGLSPDLKNALDQALAKEGMLMAATDQDAATALEKQPGSLGSATLGLIRTEKRALQPLTLNGVPPEVKGQANPQYPLFKPLYVVHRTDARPEVMRFVRFVQSAQARAILQVHGYVPADAAR